MAFNRLAVGPGALSHAKGLAALVLRGNNERSAEFRALGWTRDTSRALESFDYASLPDEVRRRAFFA